MNDLPFDATHRRPAARPAPRPSALFYRRAGVVVSGDALQVPGHHYPMAELSNLRSSRRTADPATWWAVLLSGAVLATLGAVVSAAGQPAGQDRLTYPLLVVAAGCLAAIGLYARHRARRTYEVWGEFHGRTCLLFATTDIREFGQVTRALRRAREAAEQ